MLTMCSSLSREDNRTFYRKLHEEVVRENNTREQLQGELQVLGIPSNILVWVSPLNKASKADLQVAVAQCRHRLAVRKLDKVDA